MRFVDDGVGIDPTVLAAGQKIGHFGLVGMRERVRTMHGEFTIRNRPEGGLETNISVPARVAFTQRSGLGTRLMSWISPSRRAHQRDG